MSDNDNDKANLEEEALKRPLHESYSKAEADSVLTLLFIGNTATVHNVFRADIDPMQMLAASKLLEMLAFNELSRVMNLQTQIQVPDDKFTANINRP